MDFELDEPIMDSNYDDYYDASEGGDPPPAAPPEDSEGGPVVKLEDLEEHEVTEGDVEEHRVKRKHMIRSSWRNEDSGAAWYSDDSEDSELRVLLPIRGVPDGLTGSFQLASK
ncbi:MAG: hypothetical protein FRX48_06259 [Lasallia pustulata]|uniref:Uncharacterized protein n=1 Tax=Lasallia pustulata TaxID=136370 RepID=A0A5M8PJU0_9LECA|nr:MAG: hypothetical protein FRX48_06259 [Lasallia pustulata]